MEHLELTISRIGVPCLWESGGAHTDISGCSRILTRSDGSPPNAMYVKGRNKEAYCGDHALIPVLKGMLVIRTDVHRNSITTYVSRIDAVERENHRIGVVDIFSFTGPAEELGPALVKQGYEHLVRPALVGYYKAMCRACEKPHYVRVKGPMSRTWIEIVRDHDSETTEDEKEWFDMENRRTRL